MQFGVPPAAFAILILIVAVSALGLLSAPGIIERNLLRPTAWRATANTAR